MSRDYLLAIAEARFIIRLTRLETEFTKALVFQNYPGVDIKNFTTSWSDGLAFNAILHKWKSHLFDFNNIARKHPNARLDHAFRLAQEHLDIERLLDPEGNST